MCISGLLCWCMIEVVAVDLVVILVVVVVMVVHTQCYTSVVNDVALRRRKLSQLYARAFTCDAN